MSFYSSAAFSSYPIRIRWESEAFCKELDFDETISDIDERVFKLHNILKKLASNIELAPYDKVFAELAECIIHLNPQKQSSAVERIQRTALKHLQALARPHPKQPVLENLCRFPLLTSMVSSTIKRYNINATQMESECIVNGRLSLTLFSQFCYKGNDTLVHAWLYERSIDPNFGLHHPQGILPPSLFIAAVSPKTAAKITILKYLLIYGANPLERYYPQGLDSARRSWWLAHPDIIQLIPFTLKEIFKFVQAWPDFNDHSITLEDGSSYSLIDDIFSQNIFTQDADSTLDDSTFKQISNWVTVLTYHGFLSHITFVSMLAFENTTDTFKLIEIVHAAEQVRQEAYALAIMNRSFHYTSLLTAQTHLENALSYLKTQLNTEKFQHLISIINEYWDPNALTTKENKQIAKSCF